MTGENGEAAVSVCDLLANVATYRDREVAVTGVYWYGLRQTCQYEFRTGKHVWPSALDLVGVDAAARRDKDVSFVTDIESWDRLDAVVADAARRGLKSEIWVTVRGVLRADTYLDENGLAHGGYGHLGVYPGQLIIKAISHVEARPTSTYDYGELMRRRERLEQQMP